VALQASAWVELHLWLAALAKDESPPKGTTEPAARAYARSLEHDEADLELERVTGALSNCADATCAEKAVAPFGFGSAYTRLLPSFLTTKWQERAVIAWAGIEASHAALGPEADALFDRVAHDLGFAWPPEPAVVPVVAETPAPGPVALVRVALDARGGCFVRHARDSERLRAARVVDCLMTRAIFSLGPTCAIRSTLLRDLDAGSAERAWRLLVIHVVAATVTGWEPRHGSVYRQSSMAVEPRTLEFLTKAWPSENEAAFAAKYVAHWRTRP
jgi:hypothetical protein